VKFDRTVEGRALLVTDPTTVAELTAGRLGGGSTAVPLNPKAQLDHPPKALRRRR